MDLDFIHILVEDGDLQHLFKMFEKFRKLFQRQVIYNTRLEFPVVVNAKSETVHFDTKVPYDVRNKVLVKANE